MGLCLRGCPVARDPNVRRVAWIAVWLVLLLSNRSAAQTLSFRGYEPFFTSPRQYVIYHTAEAINVDGHPSEQAWLQAPWSLYFADIEGDGRPTPALQTRFKMLWSDHALYIYGELEEPQVWAYLPEHDQVVYYDNDFEVFIDPDGDTHQYFEIEVNARKTVFDLFLPRPYRTGTGALIPWNANGLQIGVAIDGTLNNAADRDRQWSVEMVIPFRDISLGNDVQVPAEGSYWRINFSRVEWDAAPTAGVYKKDVDPHTNRPLPEHNWVWSPQGVINMHYPERWGYAWFTTRAPGTFQPTLPFSEELKKSLWLVYYKQQAYRQKHGRYATRLTALDIPSHFDCQGQKCQLTLEAISGQFTAVVHSATGSTAWKIDQEGKVSPAH
jgi:hypothetical protein